MRQASSSHPIAPLHGWNRGEAGRSRESSALDPGRVLLGFAVLSIGVLFVLESFSVLDAGRAIDRWWPVAVIVVGVSQFFRTWSVIGPGIVTGAGVLLLLASTDVLEGDTWSYVWPLILVACGVAILFGRSRVRGAADATTEDAVTATGIFGGPELRTTSQQLKRASLTAVFGGVTLDLRDALPDPAGAFITATAAFGGIDIIVPQGWRIEMRGMPVFGGIADKTDPVGEPLPPDAPTLRIDALVVFGGLDVKHKK